MTVQWGATGTIVTANTATVTSTIPATAQAGDVLIACLLTDEAMPTTLSSPPTGWTQIGSLQEDPRGGSTASVWRAICTSGGANDPGASKSWTWGATNWTQSSIHAIRNADQITPLHTFSQGMSGLSVSTWQMPSVTTTVAPTLLFAWVFCDNTESTASYSSPSTHTERFRAFSNDMSTYGITNVAATTGSHTFTINFSITEDFGGFLLAVRGAPHDLEGYRWRNDDGNETTATWAANQDTGITATPTAIRRLRTIVNATNDPAAVQYRLQYRRQGDPSTEWEDVQP